MNDFNNNPLEGVTVDLEGDNIMKWNVTIQGPEGTPYVGGKFVVSLNFDNYPFKFPNPKFVTKIYHPGVNKETGEICTRHLEATWAPVRNAAYVIEFVLSLIKNPDGENPQEVEIAQQFKSNYNQFAATAAEWTVQYAS